MENIGSKYIMLPCIDWDEIDWDKDNGVFIDKVKPTRTKLTEASRERELIRKRINEEIDSVAETTNNSIVEVTTTAQEKPTTTNGRQSTTAGQVWKFLVI